MTPRQRLDAAAPTGSALRQLACVASLAVRVDMPLLRRLRLELVPGAGAAAEFDLWFSDLLESRDDQFLVIDADIAALLRAELAAQRLPDGRHLLDLVHALLTEQHAQWAEAHQLEESLTYLGCCAASGRAPAVDAEQLLAPALAAMASSPERAREVARWARRALPRLPAAALQGEAATALDLASALHLDMPLALPADGRPQALPAALPWLLPADTTAATATTTLALEVRSDALLLHLPDEAHGALPRIVVLRSRPLLLELQVVLAGGPEAGTVRTLGFQPGQALPLPPGWVRLALRNLGGQGWQVRRAEVPRPEPQPAPQPAPAQAARKTCYVVMAFGQKTDHRTGRVLDMDRSYRLLVKPAVEAAGLDCIRADEDPRPGVLGAGTLERLLQADLVIADLSTGDLNTAYELGIRHALRPAGTLVIAEQQFLSPFDAPFAQDHIPISTYGADADWPASELAVVFRERLRQQIVDATGSPRPDSPLYLSLPFDPPRRLAPADGPPEGGPARAPAPAPASTTRQPQCFVIMGVGQATDHATGRRLNLDAAYHQVIRPAAANAGLACTRADELADTPRGMPAFEWLRDADVVVADLSTSPVRTAYQLGVRHVLRPSGTLVIADEQVAGAFDSGLLRIRRYRHGAEGVDSREAERFGTALTTALRQAVVEAPIDSPVYALLPGLQPPRQRAGMPDAAPVPAPPDAPDAPDAPAAAMPEPAAPSVDELLQAARRCQFEGRWMDARALLQTARERAPQDVRVLRQLALATYKSKQPDEVAALRAAQAMLESLDPLGTRDTETLGLWGAVHKRLFEFTNEPGALDVAIEAYDLAFGLNRGHYEGINLAFLLDLRASRDTDRKRALADATQARRLRREVEQLCAMALATLPPSASPDERFWLIATQAEAALGSGEPGAEERTGVLLARLPTEAASFMRQAVEDQLRRLRAVLRAGPLARSPAGASRATQPARAPGQASKPGKATKATKASKPATPRPVRKAR